MSGTRPQRFATIDIGSNTLLLLCVEIRDGQLVRVVDECRFGRLGQGLDRTGRLDEQAIKRSLAILADYRRMSREAGAETLRCVATEAVRKAKNQQAFIGQAEEILGASIEVIAGTREAELSCRAVWESLPSTQRGTVVIADVGGASTEIIVSRDRHMESVQSLPIGAVRLTERHLASDPPLASEREALLDDIDGVLAPLELPSGAVLVATAGTATTLAAIDKKLTTYDPDVVHGTVLSPNAVEQITNQLFAASLSAKKNLPGLDPGRADVIAGGAAIFLQLLRRLDSPHCLISDRGVRWGLAYEMA